MKLTKLQRHTAYILMLEEIEHGGAMFLCSAFKTIGGASISYNDKLFKKTLPELYNKKPKNPISENVWFQVDDFNRSRVLKQCIEETFE